MKQYLLFAACLVTVLCACQKQGDYKQAEKDYRTSETAPIVTDFHEVEDNNQELSIVSDFYPQYIEIGADNQQSRSKDYRKVIQYAEYTDTGIQMMQIHSNYLTGRLLYSIGNIRVADSVDEMGVPSNCFSPEICEIGPNGERLQPNWILEDGTFNKYRVILVDVTITNDGACLETEEDKFGNESDPYTFSAGSLLFLYNDAVESGGFYSNYDTVRYFSGMQDNADYAYSFQLTPGETADFTLGFIIGRPDGIFDNIDGLLLSNVGNSNGILIDMHLGG